MGCLVPTIGFILGLLGSLISIDRAFADAPRLAFVIGNASYPDDSKPLEAPINNARAVAEELKRIGFDVLVSENLTAQKARLAADAFKTKVKPGATVLLFFSGYGIQSFRQSYLIPIDARIWTESDVRRDGVSIDSILFDMVRAGAGTQVIILDAARQNPFERRFRSFPAGLAALTAPPPNTLVMYSTAPDKVLSEGNDGGSLFVTELLKEMRTPDLSAEDIFNRTRINVARASRNEQVPSVFSSLTEAFYFAAPSKQQSVAHETPKAIAPPPVQPPPSGPSEWERVASASQVPQPPHLSSYAAKPARPLPPNTLLWWWPQWHR